MESAAEVTASAPAPKRLRLDSVETFEEYQNVVLDMYGPDDNVETDDDDMQADVAFEADGYSDILDKVCKDVAEAFVEPRPVPTAKQRVALQITRWLCNPHSEERNVLNDSIICKLLLGDDAKAHIDGIYLTVFCVWRRQTKFSLKHVRDLTDTVYLTRALVATLSNNKVASEWSAAVAYLAEQENGITAMNTGDGYDMDLRRDAADSPDPWSKRYTALMKYQADFLGKKGKLDTMITHMVNYFQEPPTQLPVVSFTDGCFRFRWGLKWEQIPHSPANLCYIRVPAAMTYKFPEDAVRRQDVFLATCYWNKRGIPPAVLHNADLNYTCLALGGTKEKLPAVAVSLYGAGENGKSMVAASKVRLLGSEEGGCDFVDSKVLFDTTEWRINMGAYLNFLGLIFDEAGNPDEGAGKRCAALAASLVKLLIDRKKVIVRAPYAKEPGQHSWRRTAFFLISNTFPNIPEERSKAWKAWYRRFIVLPMDSAYVASLDDVDPSNGKFLADADLDNFVTSGLYTAMYMKRKVQPHIQRHTEMECITACRHPGAELDEFRQRIIGNAMKNSELPEAEASEPLAEAAAIVDQREPARRAADALYRAGILTFNHSRASKITQLGQPMDRLKNLKSYIESKVFWLHKPQRRTGAANGSVVGYQIPIADIPAGLNPANFSAGRSVYKAEVDYEYAKQYIPNSPWKDYWACAPALRASSSGSFTDFLSYKDPALKGRRVSRACGPMHLPKKPRASLYAAKWVLIDTVNCDMCITQGLKSILLPNVETPVLDKIADSDSRMATLDAMGRTKREVAAVARGKALSESDRANPMMIQLKKDLDIAGRAIEAYRTDLVESVASFEGNWRSSVQSKACQAIEDQQVQRLERALDEREIAVGGLVNDALIVQRKPEPMLREAMAAGEKYVKDELGLTVKFHIEPWPDLSTEDAASESGMPEDAPGEPSAFTRLLAFLLTCDQGVVAIDHFGPHQCIAVSLSMLFRGRNVARIPQFRSPPTLRDVVKSLPEFQVRRAERFEVGGRYLAISENHCIALAWEHDHVICSDPNSACPSIVHGPQLRHLQALCTDASIVIVEVTVRDSIDLDPSDEYEDAAILDLRAGTTSARQPKAKVACRRRPAVKTRMLKKTGGRPSTVNPGGLRVITTPLVKCTKCGSSLALEPRKGKVAEIVSFHGVQQVFHVPKRCICKKGPRKCRLRHWYNFAKVGGTNVSTVFLGAVEGLFVDTGLGFDKTYLEYNEAMQFHGCCSNMAVGRSTKQVFNTKFNDHFREHYGDARVLRLAMEASEQMMLTDCGLVKPRPHSIRASTDEKFVNAFDEWTHKYRFDTEAMDTSSVLVGDGHMKVSSKLCAGDRTPRRTGRPLASGAPKKRTNGWFVVCSAKTGEVAAATTMYDPENNDIAEQTFARALNGGRRVRRQVNCLVYDRMCKLKPHLQGKPSFRNIRHFAVDKLHGKKHGVRCACNPEHVPSLKRRFRGVNTNIAEQTFSWFRRYAHSFNPMSKLRHKFMVLNYLGKHNQFVRAGEASYLSPIVINSKKPRSRPYGC